MSKVLGALLLLFGLVAGAIGVAWAFVAIFGREWDYCAGEGGCTPGEVMALFFIVPAVAGVVGFLLLRGLTRRPVAVPMPEADAMVKKEKKARVRRAAARKRA